MPIISSLLAAILPMLLYLLLIYKMDKYEPEPIKFVLVHFMWGALGAVLLGVLGTFALGYATGLNGVSETEKTIHIIIFAPLSEEIAKGIFLFWTVNSKKFDNITDGIVYGSAIGLGFGMTENFLYFVSYGDTASSWFYLVIVRTLFSAVMHCISTGIFGSLLGMAKYGNLFSRTVLPFVGLAIGMFIHFFWNSAVVFNGTSAYGFLFMLILIALYFGIIRLSIYNEKKIIEAQLEEEVLMGIIPKNLLPIISSRLRHQSGWIEEERRKLFFRTAVHLAFSKMKFKKVRDSRKQFYLNEVNQYREALRNILVNNIQTVRDI
jgi:protease PrsW